MTHSTTLDGRESERQINITQSQTKHSTVLPTTVGIDHIWITTIPCHPPLTQPASRKMHLKSFMFWVIVIVFATLLC